MGILNRDAQRGCSTGMLNGKPLTRGQKRGKRQGNWRKEEGEDGREERKRGEWEDGRGKEGAIACGRR